MAPLSLWANGRALVAQFANPNAEDADAYHSAAEENGGEMLASEGKHVCG